MLIGIIIAIIAIYLYFDTIGSRERLKSLYGIFILFGIGFVFSKHIKSVRLESLNYFRNKQSDCKNCYERYIILCLDSMAHRDIRHIIAIFIGPVLYSNGTGTSDFWMPWSEDGTFLKLCHSWQSFYLWRLTSH